MKLGSEAGALTSERKMLFFSDGYKNNLSSMALSWAFFSLRMQPSTLTYLIPGFFSVTSSLHPSFHGGSVTICE